VAIRDSGVRYDIIARDSASRTFRTVGASASQLERGLGKLAKAAGVAGLALTAGVAVGLFEGTKKAVAFEASMKKIQTQAGASAKDVGVLSKQVLDLGKTTQQGPEKLSEALYHLKSVGMDNVDAMKALKTASDLAAVGGADLESTTNALAGAWRTGIRGATNFGQAAATVNAIIGAGNMSMEDLTAALGTGILPTAKTFGLTFSQVGAALALFTDEGVDSASAATRLRMSISLLAAPSRAAEKQLKTIGLTGNMLGQAMRSKDGIIGAIKLLSLHLQKSGLDATHQAALLSRAFGGGKSSSAILSMVNNLDVLEKKQLQVNGSMGKYGPAVEAQRKTAAAQFALIRSNFEVFSIKAGNLLLPPITAVHDVHQQDRSACDSPVHAGLGGDRPGRQDQGGVRHREWPGGRLHRRHHAEEQEEDARGPGDPDQGADRAGHAAEAVRLHDAGTADQVGQGDPSRRCCRCRRRRTPRRRSSACSSAV
jgi:TP901 family phage tail tape measure protein